MFHPTGPIVIAVASVAAFLIAMSIIATWFRKVGPNQALVVFGFRGTRVIKGHGTVVLPMLEHAHELSLELMSFDVAPPQDMYTKQGVAVMGEAVAQSKMKSDPGSIQTGAQQFLTKS